MTNGFMISTPGGEPVVSIKLGSLEWQKAIKTELEKFVLDVVEVMDKKEMEEWHQESPGS